MSQSKESDPLGTLKEGSWMIPKGNEIRELTPAQREQADSFLVTAKRNRIECLFRGEKRARLGDRLCKNKEASWGSIAEGLFYFGEKGKHFWRADAILHQEECMRWKCITRNISDLSEECFDHVLQQIDSVMRLETDETRAFCRKNSDLARCCASVEGRRGLVDLFQCLPSRTKRWVRDLFIYVIHNFSNEWFSSYTPFVSTTPSAGRAERFAISKSREGDGPCVIYLFLPNSRSDTTLNWELRSSDLEKESGKLRELGFPMINHLFFKEDEVALFSGIFPHNVFAVRDLTAKTVIWNPSVFDGVISTQSEIWKTGFPIDQSDFQARLDQTGYAKGTERLEDNDKEIYPL